MAGEVALVAESSLAAVTLVWLVAVYLKHVLFQRFVFGELGVTLVTEECPVFCSGESTAKKVNSRTKHIMVFALRFDIRHKLTTTGV